jgi:hypothetical protein
MKKNGFIYPFLILSCTSFAQLRDTSIITKSETIELSYSPTTPVSKSTITFLNFKNDYGIQFSFFIPNKYISHVYIESIDSFALGLASQQRLILNRPYKDTMFNQLDGSLFWQIIYFVEKPKFELLRKEKIVKLFVTHNSRPLELQLKRKSQAKILEFASSF